MFASEKFDIRDADEITKLAQEIVGLVDSDPDGCRENLRAIKKRANDAKDLSREIRRRHVPAKPEREPTLDEITEAYMKRSNAQLGAHYLGDGVKADVTVDDKPAFIGGSSMGRPVEEKVPTPNFSDHFPERGDPLPESANWEPVESLRDRIAMNAPEMPKDMVVKGENHVDAAWRRARWNFAFTDAMLKQRSKP